MMEVKRTVLEGDKEMNGGDIETLEEARKLVRDLRQKTRAQAQQLLAWRRAYKTQVGTIRCETLFSIDTFSSPRRKS